MDMKMVAKTTAILVPIAVLCISRESLPLNWKEFSRNISLSISLNTWVGVGVSF